MTTHEQDKSFITEVIEGSLLENAIEWIQSNMSPEDVFEQSVLEDWAYENAFSDASVVTEFEETIKQLEDNLSDLRQELKSHEATA